MAACADLLTPLHDLLCKRVRLSRVIHTDDTPVRVRDGQAGFLSIDNNVSERGIRPVAVGRKNWLFVGGERGGRTAAVLTGLIASCKQNGGDPFAYLRDVLRRLPGSRPDEMGRLLPDRWLVEHPGAVWLRRRDRAECA